MFSICSLDVQMAVSLPTDWVVWMARFILHRTLVKMIVRGSTFCWWGHNFHEWLSKSINTPLSHLSLIKRPCISQGWNESPWLHLFSNCCLKGESKCLWALPTLPVCPPGIEDESGNAITHLPASTAHRATWQSLETLTVPDPGFLKVKHLPEIESGLR